MKNKRVNPHAVKLHRAYSVGELAARLGVHKNTVRQWRREGLKPIAGVRPSLFDSATIRAFLAQRNANRKQPCPPGTLYCFRCRAPRPPALGMADFIASNATVGNIRAICATCETMMHRKARRAAIPTILPSCDVQIMEAPQRLNGRSPPTLNCDIEGA